MAIRHRLYCLTIIQYSFLNLVIFLVPRSTLYDVNIATLVYLGWCLHDVFFTFALLTYLCLYV